jgi:hypothetical protein
MKNEIVVFLLLSLTTSLQSGETFDKKLNNLQKTYQIESKILSENAAVINYYKDLLIAMMWQESHYGEFNNSFDKQEAAEGVLQIRKPFIDNINKVCGTHYKYSDRLSFEKSIEMFIKYQEHYNPERNLEVAAKIWNGGQNCDLKSHNVCEYWKLIQEHIKNPHNLAIGNTIVENYKNLV